MSIWGYGRERNGILGNLLNSNPMALKHLMPALMHFYIGVCVSCYLVNTVRLYMLHAQRLSRLVQARNFMTNLVSADL